MRTTQQPYTRAALFPQIGFYRGGIGPEGGYRAITPNAIDASWHRLPF